MRATRLRGFTVKLSLHILHPTPHPQLHFSSNFWRKHCRDKHRRVDGRLPADFDTNRLGHLGTIYNPLPDGCLARPASFLSSHRNMDLSSDSMPRNRSTTKYPFSFPTLACDSYSDDLASHVAYEAGSDELPGKLGLVSDAIRHDEPGVVQPPPGVAACA